MSQAESQAGAFDKALLETYTDKQLKGFCRDMVVLTQCASGKEEFQMALRAWAEAHSEEDAEEEEPEDGCPEDFLPSVDDVTTAIVPPPKLGSSVSDQGLTTEERREEREFQLQMAGLQIEAQQEERRAEREAKHAEAEREAKQIEAERAEAAAERALAAIQLLLAHELTLKELEIKASLSPAVMVAACMQDLLGRKRFIYPRMWCQVMWWEITLTSGWLPMKLH
ncbi:hypothetical protein NDU88_004860 [Pleurodeles waltl]|uniref:Uncharacterized protein n=1 Tax=Pleurodeles waltl TaxID=8319 RepID=A0AAV7QD64_PLEWA|nr:hypothetical protein NDU88_004860 [Pleurodeles waltl]